MSAPLAQVPEFAGRHGFACAGATVPVMVDQFPALTAQTKAGQPVYVADPAKYENGRFLAGFWTPHIAQAYQFADFAEAVRCYVWLQGVQPSQTVRVVECVPVPDAKTDVLILQVASIDVQPPLVGGRLTADAQWYLDEFGNLFGFAGFLLAKRLKQAGRGTPKGRG